MTKIVYNACYGGFDLSTKAMELYLTKIVANYTPHPSGGFIVDGRYFSADDIERDDPALVEVVEELGDEANTDYSYIMVADLTPGTRYFIHEYDGLETLETVDRIVWKTA